MSLYFSQLIYGGGINTDAQPLPPRGSLSAKSNPDQSSDVNDKLSDYEDNDFDYDYEDGENDNKGGQILTHLSQNSPQHWNLSHDSPLSLQSQSPPSHHQDTQSPQAVNLSQDSLLSIASPSSLQSPSPPAGNNLSSYLHQLAFGEFSSPSVVPDRSQSISYQSQVHDNGESGASPPPDSPQDPKQHSQGSSSYLSQMIYGHPDHCGEDDEKLPNQVLSQEEAKKQAIREKKRKREDEYGDKEYNGIEEEQVIVNEIATNMLNTLFSGEHQGMNPDTVESNKKAATSLAAAPAFENPFLTCGHREEISQDGKLEAADHQGTAKAQQKREENRGKRELHQLKVKRNQEWRKFRASWKKRKLDLRKEDDVGNAYLLRARLALEPKLFGQEQKQSHQGEGTEEEFEEDREQDEEATKPPPYDSEDEKVNALQQISQSLDHKEAQRDKDMDQTLQKRELQREALERHQKPFTETMDFWHQGKSEPDPEELDFLYGKAPPARGGKRRRDGSSYSESTILLKGEVNQPEPDADIYFHFPLHHRQFASAPFIQNLQLIRVAVRCITKGNGEHDDRLLRALWQPDHQKFRRFQLLLVQTQEYGQNMATYLGHIWKNDRARRLVAKRLGICKQNEFDPPPGLMGYSMEAEQVQSLCNIERQRLVRQYSLKKMPTIQAGHETALALDNGKKRRLIAAAPTTIAVVLPTTRYIHLPGTLPPVPTFPLDETNLIFGPTDRHKPFRHVGGIDEATYKLTLASLVTRLAKLQQKAQAVSDADHHQYESQSFDYGPQEDLSDEIQQLREQLYTFVDQAPAAAKTNLFKRFQRNDPQVEIPLVQLYRAIMAFCSFVVTGCPQPKLQTAEAKQSDACNIPYSLLKPELPDEEGGDALKALAMKQAANKIYYFCEPLIRHNGLRAFPRIHLTFGLATIARLLPASAAFLLSAPLDHQNRTPFDIFRRTLKNLETQSVLIEDDHVTDWMGDEDLVRIGELEFALHRAVEIFGSCIKRDPIDVRYHEWRLGALGASLLLCSGHRLGSRALPFPSSHYKKQDAANGNNPKKRKTLGKFDEVRQSTTEALKLLIQLTQQQSSNRGHLAVSSFWEWKQVVALVAGRFCFSSTHLMEICSSHLYHTAQWASQDQTTSALKYLEILTRSEPDSSDLRLKQFAAVIERDPNNVQSWRSLVAALGPLGFTASQDKARLTCDPTICKECQMLREGFTRDHHSLDARKSSGMWWGNDLIEWWYPHFLSTTLRVPNKYKTPQLMDKIERAILACFVDTSSTLMPGAQMQSSIQPQLVDADTNWLWSGDEDAKYDIYGQDEDQESNADTLLPKPFAEVIRSENNPKNSCHLAETGAEVEAAYLKLVVICHLFGVAHPYALEIIYELCRRSVKGKLNKLNQFGREWRCLQELSRLGVDILKVVRLYQATTFAEQETEKAKRPANPRFTEAQREAVRDGLELFGYGRWSEMSQNYEVLDGLSRFVIRDIYKWIVKHEGMETGEEVSGIDERIRRLDRASGALPI